MIAESAVKVLSSRKGRVAAFAGSSAVLGSAVALLLTAQACRRAETTEAQPARIVSGSMAEQYWGQHWQVTCEDCGYTFRCGVEHPPGDMLAICPMCGYCENAIDGADVRPGRPVEILRRDFHSQPPQRWEVVAFAEPSRERSSKPSREPSREHSGEPSREHSGERRTAVKRVVGLPGQRVAIRGGEIIINGETLQKSLAELRDVAQLVHDADYLPRDESLPARWSSPRDDSAWRIAPGRFTHLPAMVDTYIRYHHWRGAPVPHRRTDLWPVLDNYAYNQGLLRQLNEVADILLTFEARLGEGGPLLMRIHDGWQNYRVDFDPRDDTVSVHDEEELARADAPVALAGKWIDVQVAACDGRLLVGLDGMSVLTMATGERAEPPEPAPSPLAIGAGASHVEIRNIRLWRDVYYLNPHHRGGDWEMDAPLGEDEYFVLGDNPPNSVDSRHWGPISRERISGVVRPRSEP